jgi:hypothetical protein
VNRLSWKEVMRKYFTGPMFGTRGDGRILTQKIAICNVCWSIWKPSAYSWKLNSYIMLELHKPKRKIVDTALLTLDPWIQSKMNLLRSNAQINKLSCSWKNKIVNKDSNNITKSTVVLLTTGGVEFINLWVFSVRPTVAILDIITIYIVAKT